MIAGKNAQRILGVLMVAVSAYMTWQQWHTALTEGYFYDKAAAIFPAFSFIGIGLVLFPIDPRVLQEKYGAEKITSWQQLPGIWKFVVVLAIALGAANYFLLRSDIAA
jgi:hypothetical protein